MRGAFLCLSLSFAVFAEEDFILLNGVKNEVVYEVGSHILSQVTPCSTFKIALSLMGYDAEILKDVLNPVWDFQEGYDDYLESWKASLTPEAWMKYSCVWYSQILALQLGSEKLQSYLTAFQYGNEDIADKEASAVWINSSLKISPREQVEFIQKMIAEKLPVSSHATQMTKVLLFKEELDGGSKLFGKTGWSGSRAEELAWFVGWIENAEGFFPFAYLIRDQKIQLNQRIPRVKQLLHEAGL